MRLCLSCPRLPPLEMAWGADTTKTTCRMGGSSVLVRPLRSNILRAQGGVARQQRRLYAFCSEACWTARRNASSSARPSRRPQRGSTYVEWPGLWTISHRRRLTLRGGGTRRQMRRARDAPSRQRHELLHTYIVPRRRSPSGRSIADWHCFIWDSQRAAGLGPPSICRGRRAAGMRRDGTISHHFHFARGPATGGAAAGIEVACLAAGLHVRRGQAGQV